ncbi:unnamed protein product [Citrullus colocynthis]|uniref:Uncharacterized protein n=1 Tax=Citrullus colocynthis TaxID=252529 RepID=A0ABP0Y0A7_9ROSI
MFSQMPQKEISAVKVELLDSTSVSNFDHDKAVKRINDYVENAITEYLSIGSPESCCEKLQELVTLGFCDKQAEDEEGKQPVNLRLHPLHFLLLNAYTALASAYKVRSCATHHLFLSETSLIASAANCWVAAGESLLILARHSSLWATTNSSKWGFPVGKRMCSNCSWFDKFNASRILGRSIEADFREFSCISNCIANMSQKTWSFDPFDFNWSKTIMTYSSDQDIGAHNIDRSCACSKTKDVCFQSEPQHSNQERKSIIGLGIHCLFYGGYLASIFYGHHSHLSSQIQNILRDLDFYSY